MVTLRTRLLFALLAAALTLAPLVSAPAEAAPGGDAGSTLVVIDVPRGGTSGTQLNVSGWAADPRSPSGTGVDRVEVYLDGERGADGTYLGQATYGLARPDVAAHLGGARFGLSGFALVANVTPGPHTVYVYAHASSQPGDEGWAAPKTAAVLAGAGGAPVAAAPGVPLAPPSGAVTLRPVAGSGSITLDLPYGAGAYYPPGPADTGGPIWAPTYWGYGWYGSVPPFVGYPFDYPPYAVVDRVPGNFDFSYGYGSDFYSPSWLAWASTHPRRYLRYLANGPLYCPAFTYVFC